MAQTSGVCAIVPRGQDHFRPRVVGMGILLNDYELVTCAHVVDEAIGSAWSSEPGEGEVFVCFPFTIGPKCIKGVVDRERFYKADRPEQGKLTDIAVIRLVESAPPEVGRAELRQHSGLPEVTLFGFRFKKENMGWSSHPDGEHATSRILGPLPGGRIFMESISHAGTTVEPGFSGSGVYDHRLGAVVGMTVEASAEPSRANAQFIEVDSLLRALGRPVAPPLPPRVVPQPMKSQAETLKADIEKYLKTVCELLGEPDPDVDNPLLAYLQPILQEDTPRAITLRAAFGFPAKVVEAGQLYEVVKSNGERTAPFFGLMAQRVNHLLWRTQFTLECINQDWASEGRRRAATIQTVCQAHLMAKQPTLQTMQSVFQFVLDMAYYTESAPDSTLYAVLRAFDHTQPNAPAEPPAQGTQLEALNFLFEFLMALLRDEREVNDSSHAWWALRTGIWAGDIRFRGILSDFINRYGDISAPSREVVRRAAVPEIYKPLRTAAYTLSNAQAIIEHDQQLGADVLDRIHKIILVMAKRLLSEPQSKQLYLASVHHEGLRNFLDYIDDQELTVS